MDVFNPGERAMTGPTIIELGERIAMIRENINESNRPLRTPVPKMKTGRQTGSRSKSRNSPSWIELGDALLRR